MNENKNSTKYIIFYSTILVLSSLLFAVNMQFNNSFKSTTIESIIYNLISLDSLEAAVESFSNVIIKFTYHFVIVLCVSLIPLIACFFFNREIRVNIFKKKILLFPLSFKNWSLFLLGVSLAMLIFSLHIPRFIFNNITYSDFYEKNYVEYDSDMVKFPKEKRNLITIYVESFENSVFSLENGGANKISYMPLMEELSSKYINFSNTDKIGGAYEVRGTSWTASALVAETAGVPIFLKTNNDKDKFLDGAVSLGEVLEDNGYKNYFLMGSDANFGKRNSYFTEHGSYDITDYFKAKKDRLIHESYYTWWGFEDKKLYSFAKRILSRISQSGAPFNFSMLTVDTHFYDGYVDESCPKKFDEQYANSYYCADIMLVEFIEWIQKQKFYEDTTIVIVGDHLTMRDNFFDNPKGQERVIYNLFINSSADTENIKNREFSSFDIYPTTLAALGATIDGNRLALGTNLFSDEDTLIEKYGLDYVNKMVSKKSRYYNKNILKD